MHTLYAGRIGNVEQSHTPMLLLTADFLFLSIGKQSSLRSVKYLYFISH
jgi:hypothetical protein